MGRRRWGGRGLAVSLLAIMIILIETALTSPALAAPSGKRYYADQTGHTIANPFLSSWAQLDGQQTLGLPVTELETLRDRDAQYFEYGVLRARSTSRRDPKIEPIPVGTDLLTERHEPDRLVSGRRVGGHRFPSGFRSRPEPDNDRVRYEPSTGHAISGRIRAYFDRNGGTSRFGRPLSESYVAAGMRVQWFEFGRIQWRLSDERPELGPVGLELAVERALDTGPVERDSLAPFEPNRFRRYLGDGTIPQAVGPFEPTQIRIPAISIDARIEQVPIVEGTMEVPKDVWNVGWYPTIAAPGEYTNVVVAGHKDWWNVGPVVFYNLERLNPGDKIYLLGGDGAGFAYQVVDRWLIDSSTHAQEIVSDTGQETLTLITCGGPFNGAEYENRVIVRAERI